MKSALSLAVMLLGFVAPVAHADDVAHGPPFGRWMNPYKTVEVQTAVCGSNLCGTIVWAAPEAKSDAKEAGVDQLIGLQLLSGYREKSRGHWQGEVFVPDLNRRFFSRMDQLAPGRVKISGCILGGLICRSQIWTRV